MAASYELRAVSRGFVLGNFYVLSCSTCGIAGCLPAGRCHSLQRLELFSASQKINNEAILQYAKNEGKN